MALRDPPPPSLAPAACFEAAISDVGRIEHAALVVHDGPPDEMHSLVDRAADLSDHVVVVGPGGLDVYPAHPLFAHVGHVVTAAGFNAVRQAAPWRDRHHVVPFERALDDQFERARRLEPPVHRADPLK